MPARQYPDIFYFCIAVNSCKVYKSIGVTLGSDKQFYFGTLQSESANSAKGIGSILGGRMIL